MILNLYIDSRENDVYNNIIERDLDIYKDKIELSKKQLDIGDILITFDNDDNNIQYIFERKTITDLLSSIKDGRYKEQKSRLLSGNFTNITYIIEGNDNIIASKNIKQNLLTSIYTHLIYRDNIHIVFTKDVIETVSYILILSGKIIDNPNKFLKNINTIKTIKTNITDDSNNGISDIPDISYIDNIKLKSKKITNITPSVCYLMQLSQIPYISNTIAKNIYNKYPTFKDFIYALDRSDNKMELLCNIDKIGLEKAKKILEYLSYPI